MHAPGTALIENDREVVALDIIRALGTNKRFRRDTSLGAIFHPGKICFREISPTDSLHIIIDGDNVSAHVDDISPLVIRADGSHRYSWGRVVAHNAVCAATGLARRIRGQHGLQRCNLRCQVEWFDDDDENDGGIAVTGCA